MISGIRLATPEEVEAIRKDSDLTNATRVLVFDNDRAVIRMALEVDPVHFAKDTPKHKRALFLWGIENTLRLEGVPEYYFNVRVEDQEFIDTVKGFGAVQVSRGPELRFKKTL